MASPNFRIRRATLDDLAALKKLWESHQLSSQPLEKRLTEFQVVEDAGGNIVAAIGLRIEGRHANVHSEVFGDFSATDEARPLFWQRIEALASNHGVARLWTQESTPFWTRNGFQPPTPEILEKRPASWANDGQWLTLRLRDEEALHSLDKEINILMAAEKRRTGDSLETAKTVKMVVTIAGFLLAAAIFAAAAYFFVTRANIAR